MNGKMKKLEAQYIGRKIIYNDVTGSTMDDARKFGVNEPVEYPHGTVVLAERQTKARGARDHKWDASNTGNIYASIILHLPQTYKTFEGRFDLEVAACMAVFEVVGALGVRAVPKWPNDLWLRGHKLAGFLVEDAKFDIPNSNSCLVILGMGINVNADVRRNNELYSIATSLMCERNGQPVCREEFLSDICLALEESLVSRTNNLLKYRTHNLFQKGCHISVTCASESRVMDGEFVEVCDNWDVKFTDKRTGDTVSGRSDYFTIRPKVLRKILVVFTGIASSKSASVVASRLTAIVDTSKWVVCAVPETTVSQMDDWMKTCDLLVLAEDVCDSVRLTSKLTQYLKRGGNLLTTGVASYFAAKIFEIPYKEGVLQSMVSNNDVSVISVEYNDSIQQQQQEEGDGHGGQEVEVFEEHPGKDSSSSSTLASPPSVNYVIFPTSLIHFKFSQSYTMKNSSSSSSISSENGKSSSSSTSSSSSSLPSRRDFSRSDSRSQKSRSSSSSTSTINDDKELSFKYYSVSNGGKPRDCCVAVMTKVTSYGGTIAIFGFDLGYHSLPEFKSSEETNQKTDGEKTDKEVEERKNFERVAKDVERDRFKRDQLIYQVLNVLNVT